MGTNFEKNLTKRAYLTSISKIFQQAAGLIVTFFITPIVIRGLGAELYGIWSMIQQTVGYLALSDFKPMSTLKYTLAVKQHSNDYDEKKRMIGASLLVWAISMPLFLFLGYLLVSNLHCFIHFSQEHYTQIQIALIIMIIALAIDSFSSMPGNILRGINLEYKAMGLGAAIVVLNGIIIAVAVRMQLGLPGVAGATAIGLIVSGIFRYLVVRKAISWFGMSCPNRKEMFDFVKKTVWITFSSLSILLLVSSDIIIIGYFLGPQMVAIYATTNLVIKVTSERFGQIIGSTNAGLVGICGKGDWLSAMKIRSEMFVYAIFGVMLIGANVIALNKHFIGLWVESDLFTGIFINLLLVIVAILKQLFVLDNLIVTGVLELKRTAISAFISGFLSVVTSIILIKIIGLTGVALGSILGLVCQVAYYQWIIHCKSKCPLWVVIKPIAVPVLKAAPVLIFAFIFSKYINIDNWFVLGVDFLLISICALVYQWSFVLNSEDRKVLLDRVKYLKIK